MKMWMSAAAAVLMATAAVRADTLILRDGRRVQGQLVSVRGDEVEFEAQRGFFGGRDRQRYDRRDVAGIEFDGDDRSDQFDRDRRDDDRRDRGGRPSGMRERSVSVDSWVPWVDSGVQVRAGQMVYFSATGRVRWGPNRQDGPAGEHDSPRNDARPIPGRPAVGLVGRVGDSNDVFFIGDDQGPIRMRTSGRLYLGVNDDYLKDNTGSFRVTVFY
jgi:hypothetical protein